MVALFDKCLPFRQQGEVSEAGYLPGNAPLPGSDSADATRRRCPPILVATSKSSISQPTRNYDIGYIWQSLSCAEHSVMPCKVGKSRDLLWLISCFSILMHASPVNSQAMQRVSKCCANQGARRTCLGGAFGCKEGSSYWHAAAHES